MTSLQQQRLKAYLDHMIQAIEQVCECLAHISYASIDYELVWQVANKDLLELHSKLKQIKLSI
jgi:uncharacterized protein with HEPN domain